MVNKTDKQENAGTDSGREPQEGFDVNSLASPKVIAGVAAGTALAVISPALVPVIAAGAAVYFAPKVIPVYQRGLEGVVPAYKQGVQGFATAYKEGAQSIISAYAQVLSPIFKTAASAGQKVAGKVSEVAAEAGEKLGDISDWASSKEAKSSEGSAARKKS